MLVPIGLIIFAYLLGSFASAVIVSRLMGLPDPRNFGSGNPGATNVLRLGGKKAALLTLLFDVLKGVVAVLLAKAIYPEITVLAAVTGAVFLGHLYPVFFNFKGGKGVATAFGALLALVWQVGLSVLLTWLLMAGIVRYSSLAALVAAVAAPVSMYLFTHGNLTYTVTALLMSSLLIWRHRSNIQNLLAGREDKIGKATSKG
ncbi:MAG: glycerol-3-phosphate 1-O-acyltransferase PlsY [Thiotrichaceae bacterium]|nr:glycerol-3-phosphate 1-O-acyltransferase PlsY [Thiotrichaceae bacterium]